MSGPTSLVTLADVKDYLRISTTSDDTQLQDYIDAVTPVIEDITGPIVNKQYTEVYDGGVSRIQVRHFPVVSVDTLTEVYGQTLYTLTQVTLGSSTSTWSYTFDASTGLIVRRAFNVEAMFPIGANNVSITYTAGRSTVPANVALAAKMTIQHLWSQTRFNRNGARPGLGGDDIWQPGMGFAIPNRVRELLQNEQRIAGIA